MAADDGDVDPYDVLRILNISKCEANVTTNTNIPLLSKASGNEQIVVLALK